MDIQQILTQFKQNNYKLLKLDELGNLLELSAVDIAKKIIEVSDNGKNLVNFKVASSHEYWEYWTHRDRGTIIKWALDHMGYIVSYKTNESSDGILYYLQKK